MPAFDGDTARPNRVVRAYRGYWDQGGTTPLDRA